MAEKYKIEMISIEQIHVTNTRDRTEKKLSGGKGQYLTDRLKKACDSSPLR